LNELGHKIHQLINQYRNSKKLVSLSFDKKLTNIARKNCQEMFKENKSFKEANDNGRTKKISKIFSNKKVVINSAYYRGSSVNAEIIVQFWLKSTEHRKNILGDYSVTGIGFATNSNGEYYFSQIFTNRKTNIKEENVMTVKEILKTKGPEVVSISEEKSLPEAIASLVNNSIGALIVLNESGKIAGIISERDILRENNKDYGSPAKVKDVMTRDVIIGDPEDKVDYVEHIMIQNRVRHLPIIDNKRLVGIISIGDVIKAQLNGVRVENRYLQDFIGAKY